MRLCAKESFLKEVRGFDEQTVQAIAQTIFTRQDQGRFLPAIRRICFEITTTVPAAYRSLQFDDPAASRGKLAQKAGPGITNNLSLTEFHSYEAIRHTFAGRQFASPFNFTVVIKAHKIIQQIGRA